MKKQLEKRRFCFCGAIFLLAQIVAAFLFAFIANRPKT